MPLKHRVMQSLDATTANSFLDRVQLEIRGESISVRGTFPSKFPNQKPHSQRISLGLKIDDNDAIKVALKKALDIQTKLNQDSFQWRDYDKSYHSIHYIEQSINTFRQNFLNNSKKNIHSSFATWTGGYEPYLRRLMKIQKEKDLPYDSNLFLLTLQSYKLNSSSRLKCSLVLKKLALQENIILHKDWDKITGIYIPSKDKEPPSDEEIIRIYNEIPNEKWRWIFALLATYGLRTHEAFFCSPEDLLNSDNVHNTIRVYSKTKTGERLVYPLRPEWVDLFNLKEIHRPNLKTELDRSERTMKHISNNVSKRFRIYNLGFIPYSLRHAYAIRSIHYKLNPSIVAKMMGHSVLIHTKTYHKYLLKNDLDKAYSDAVS